MSDKRETRLWQELNSMTIVAIASILLVLIGLYYAFTYWSPSAEVWKPARDLLLNTTSEVFPTFIGILIALTFLRGRQDLEKKRNREEIALQVVSELREELMATTPTVEHFFIPPPDITPLIASAKNIDLCGVVLSATIKTNFTAMIDGIQAGKTFRVLLADIESARASAKRSRAGNADQYAAVQVLSISDLGSILREANLVSHTGSLSVRVLDHVPTMSIKSFDSGSAEKGRIFVEVYPYKLDNQLHFALSGRDGHWFPYFHELFETLWNSGKDVILDQVSV